MPDIFMVYLGGRAPKANIELHDIQFVAADAIEETYPILRERWFGQVQGLHLDSYVVLRFVDGYRLELKRTPSLTNRKLYFVNCGGYDPSSIAELHAFGLFVAESPEEAKRRAKAHLLVNAVNQHKDDMFEVDDCFVVNKVGEYFVHLEPDERTQALKPDWFGYNVIG